MEVRLVVASGKNAGRVVPVTGGRFFIGRAEDCQLRPNTDLISRHHCAITVEDGFVTVRDFGSRNGTFVNDERIRGEEELNNGDTLSVGPLKFVVELVVEMTGQKKPKVENVQEAAARTVESSSQTLPKEGDEFDLSDWLGGDADADNDTRALHQTTPGTVAFQGEQATTPTQSTSKDEAEDDASAKDKKKSRKDEAKKPGRLPSGLMKPKSADSQAAAADTLRHFFHRR
ncbi:MAG: FHA domain-containing protein [Pirellulales bacterium]|nr:FHA domain-containing protein [Pirellulales bacterium]